MRSVRGILFAALGLAAAALPAAPAVAGPTQCTFVAPATHCTGGDCFPGGVLKVTVVMNGVIAVTGTATCAPFTVSCTAVAAAPCTAATPISAVPGTFLQCDATIYGIPTGWSVTCSI